MTRCVVTERRSDEDFDRDVEFRGQSFSERLTLQAPHRVVFTRIAGPVRGVIVNEIEGGDDDLHLRFSYSLVVEDAEPGSRAEEEYAAGMSGDYLKAVEATLDADPEEVNDLGESFEIISDPSNTVPVRTAVQQAGLDYDSAEVEFRADFDQPVSSVEDAHKLFRVIDALEDSDDVQNVFTNVDIPDEIASQLDED